MRGLDGGRGNVEIRNINDVLRDGADDREKDDEEQRDTEAGRDNLTDDHGFALPPSRPSVKANVRIGGWLGGHCRSFHTCARTYRRSPGCRYGGGVAEGPFMKVLWFLIGCPRRKFPAIYPTKMSEITIKRVRRR